MAFCHGNGPEHCCEIEGRDCEFLEEGTAPGRRWACGLLRAMGTWEAVYASVEYQGSRVARWLAEHLPGYGCGDYPQNMPEIMNKATAGKCCFEEARSG